MAKYVIKHPNLNFVVSGKTQKLEVGAEVELTELQAKKLGKKVAPFKAAKSVKLDDKKKG